MTKCVRVSRESLIGFACTCCITLAMYFLPITHYIIGKSPFLWLFNYLFNSTYQRVSVNDEAFSYAERSLESISMNDDTIR